MTAFPFAQVNLWAVLVSAAAMMILGFLWYSTILFGKTWMKLVNADPKKMKRGPMVGVIWGCITTLFQVYFIAVLILVLKPVTALEGVHYAFLFWLGLEAPLYLGPVLWEQKSMKLFWINASYGLVGLLITVSILFNWK